MLYKYTLGLVERIPYTASLLLIDIPIVGLCSGCWNSGCRNHGMHLDYSMSALSVHCNRSHFTIECVFDIYC